MENFSVYHFKTWLGPLLSKAWTLENIV